MTDPITSAFCDSLQMQDDATASTEEGVYKSYSTDDARNRRK